MLHLILGRSGSGKTQYIRSLLRDLAKQGARDMIQMCIRDRPYLSLLGARASQALMEALQNCVSLPVQNDTCTGKRSVSLPADWMPDNLWEAYASALLGQTPCCLLYTSQLDRKSR